jgi:hypothetical protein
LTCSFSGLDTIPRLLLGVVCDNESEKEGEGEEQGVEKGDDGKDVSVEEEDAGVSDPWTACKDEISMFWPTESTGYFSAGPDCKNVRTT